MTTAEQWDYLFKVVMVGDMGVGKTSLSARFADGVWLDGAAAPSAGVDFKIRTLVLDGLVVAVQLWDNAGDFRFKSIQGSYFRGAHCVLGLYDPASAESASNLRAYFQEAAKHCPDHALRYVVSTKCDVADAAVPAATDEAAKVAEAFRAARERTSAKTGENIDTLLTAAARTVLAIGLFPYHSFFVSPLNKEFNGYLLKRGHIVKNWKKRHFRLRKGLLLYFENESSRKPLGVIGLRNCSLARGEEPTLFALRGRVKGKLKDFYFKAEKGEQEREEWLTAITGLKDVTCAHVTDVLSNFRVVENRYAVNVLWEAIGAAPSTATTKASFCVGAAHPCEASAQELVYSLLGLAPTDGKEWGAKVEFRGIRSVAHSHLRLTQLMALGTHARVGAGSPVALMTQPLLRRIVGLLDPPDPAEEWLDNGAMVCSFASIDVASEAPAQPAVPAGTHGLVLVFDVADEYSFMAVFRYLVGLCSKVRWPAIELPCVVLCGVKGEVTPQLREEYMRVKGTAASVASRASLEFVEVPSHIDGPTSQRVMKALIASTIAKRRPFPWIFKTVEKLYTELQATEAQAS